MCAALLFPRAIYDPNRDRQSAIVRYRSLRFPWTQNPVGPVGVRGLLLLAAGSDRANNGRRSTFLRLGRPLIGLPERRRVTERAPVR
jgi:hypothetical protein